MISALNPVCPHLARRRRPARRCPVSNDELNRSAGTSVRVANDGARATPLAVYLVHWRQVDWVSQAVDSLLASTFPVIVHIINNSPELHAELQQRIGSRATVQTVSHNLGYAGAANVALAHSTQGGHEFAVIGSHDLHVRPDTLGILVDLATNNPEFGVIGPVIEDRIMGASSATEAASATQAIVETSWISGTCLLIRQECARAVGGFDEVYGSYSEDVDYCWRARAAGWKIGLVGSTTAHGLGSADADKVIDASINAVRTAWLHEGPRATLTAYAELLWLAVRSFAAGFAPFRTGPERGASRHRSRLLLRSACRPRIIFESPRREIRFAEAAAPEPAQQPTP